MKKNIGLVILLVVFSIGYFIVANMVSYYFDVDFEEDLYNLKITAIEEHATIYAQNNIELFDDSNSIYMTVEELALENVIISNGEGVVSDPRNEGKSLNDLKVKITNENDNITAKVLV